jgi:hypothetical protein
LDGPIHNLDLWLLGRDLVLKWLIGLTFLLELLIVLQLLSIDGCQFILFPSFVEVELSIELLDFLTHKINLLFEGLFELMELFIGWDEVFLLLIVIFDFLHDLLELLVREHVLFDFVLDGLEVLVLEIDLILKCSESVLELLFIRWLDGFLLESKSWDFFVF